VKVSDCCQTRSVTWLTAVRLSRLAPVASRKAASMSHVLSPRANISTARRSSSTHGLEEPDLVSDPKRFVGRHGKVARPDLGFSEMRVTRWTTGLPASRA
jgi:hypothetical protein